MTDLPDREKHPCKRENATVGRDRRRWTISAAKSQRSLPQKGFTVIRRSPQRLQARKPLVKEIEAGRGRNPRPFGSMRARRRKSPPSSAMPTSMRPLEVCIFNIGAQRQLPDWSRPTERVFSKSPGKWLCYFWLSSRPRSGASDGCPGAKANIFFTGATAKALRGGSGYGGLRPVRSLGCGAVAQATGARVWVPKASTFAHLIIDFRRSTTEWVRQRRIEALGAGCPR